MTRSTFISYQHDDQGRAKGFNLLRWAKNVDLTFVGRHLLDPVESENPTYVRSKIREQINNTSVTVVLVGEKTCESDWVTEEIEISLTKNPPNGILAVRISPDAQIPQALMNCGAEVVDWLEPSDVKDIEDAIERAALAAGRAPLVPTSAGGGGCAR